MQRQIALLIFLLSCIQIGSGYILKSDVLSGGGTGMFSSSYIAKGSLSQMTTSSPWLTSSGYKAIVGFWHPYPFGPGVEEKFSGQGQIPFRYFLYPNTPNPVRDFLTIKYSIAKRNKVILDIYNPLGQKVATLIDEVQNPGDYKVTWHLPKNCLPAGVYFYRLKAGDYESIKKMVLLQK
ncbi:MAG: T9SS type A sorting domain-containing protein [candidate division WOR-3 bacterium]